MLVVHNSIPSRLIDSPSDTEAVAIHLHGCNFVVCAIYVSPYLLIILFSIYS